VGVPEDDPLVGQNDRVNSDLRMVYFLLDVQLNLLVRA